MLKIGNRVFSDEEAMAIFERAHHEAMLIKNKAAEIERIFGHISVDFENHDLILTLYNRVKKSFRSVGFGLEAVYLLGYIYGIRAERQRRRENSINKNTLPDGRV